jgi:hypothetical protein
MSTQLREILYTDSHYMLVLSSFVPSSYYECCSDGSTSPGNYGCWPVEVHWLQSNVMFPFQDRIKSNTCDEQEARYETLLTLWTWKWRKHFPPKHLRPFTELDAVMSHINIILSYSCESLKKHHLHIVLSLMEKFIFTLFLGIAGRFQVSSNEILKQCYHLFSV